MKVFIPISYGIIGLWVFIDTFIRLYQEGTFGNETSIDFLISIGPEIGFLKLASSLFLIISQVLQLFDKKNSIVFARISFLFALLTSVLYYLIFQMGYIWSYVIDFVVFSSLLTLLYLPIIIKGLVYNNLKTKTV